MKSNTEIREKESEIPVFDIRDRGFGARAFYLKDTSESRGDALIEITRNEHILRRFLFPAYKIWNISAHFSDIVDGELAGDFHGYEMAAWTGF